MLDASHSTTNKVPKTGRWRTDAVESARLSAVKVVSASGDKWKVSFPKVGEWWRDEAEVLYELPVVPHKAQEAAAKT